MNLHWYKSQFPEKLENQKIYKLKDVDIIVKVLQDVRCFIDGSFYDKIVFVDNF